MEILNVENLTKVYTQGEQEIKALDHVSFSVEKGQFIAILGASGSGKSTLLHLLGGVDKPTEGTVSIEGESIYTLRDKELAIFRRRNIGLIYQFYNLIPILNAEENIILPLLLDGREAKEEQMDDLLDVLGLKERVEHLPNQLSGGQQQRVSIGRALITNPSLLLADEPTGNLDSKNSKEILQLFRNANEKYKQTIIMITHDEKIAAQCDRIIYISDGKITRDEMV